MLSSDNEAAIHDTNVLCSRFARFTWPMAVDAGLTTLPPIGQQPSTWPKKGWLAGPEKPPPALEHPNDQLIFVMQAPYGLDLDKVCETSRMLVVCMSDAASCLPHV